MEGTITNMLNNPAVNGIVDNFRDVTEKVLAEKELKLIQYGIDNVADSVFWVNPDGKIKNVNQAACQILEYSKEELTNLTIPEIDPDMPENLWLIHMAELKEKGTLIFETQHTTKSGRNIPVEIRANFIKFGDDEMNCSFVRDISNRKAKQNLLIQKDRRLMEAQELAKIGSWEIDLVGKIAKLSDETCRIYGLETSQNIQKLEDWIGYLHPEDKDRVLESKQISGKHSDQNDLKYRIVLKNGTIKHVRDKSKVEFNPAGQPVLVLGITQDITDLIS
jgi:PAS domain S-box-containing protein